MDKTSEKKAAKAIRDKRYRLRKKLDAGTITGAESDWLYRVETGNPAPGEEVEAPEVMAEADILPPPAPALVRGEAIARAVDEALTEAGAVTTPEAEAIVRRAVEPLGVTVEAETEPWGSGLNWSARLGPGTSEDVIHSAEHGPDCSGESGPIADPIDLGLVNCLECLQFRERAVWLTLSVDERRKMVARKVEEMLAARPDITREEVGDLIRSVVGTLPEGEVKVNIRFTEGRASLDSVEIKTEERAEPRYFVAVKSGEKVLVVIHNGKGIYKPSRVADIPDSWSIYVGKDTAHAAMVRRFIRARCSGVVEVLLVSELARILTLEQLEAKVEGNPEDGGQHEPH